VVLGPVADHLLVSARDESGEVAVYLVDAGADGVEVTGAVLIDGQPVASAELVDVEVAGAARVATEARLDEALVAGTVATAATTVGGARRALDLTVGYLREREQFGVPIGAYQALQHRAARLHCRVLLSESLTLRALEALDADDPGAARRVHAAKAMASETYLHVAEEGVQMHGGIGMTDESEIGFHLVAARVAQMELGDAAFHRSRYAALSGY
jgi:acyl-CoA dehydrogenase